MPGPSAAGAASCGRGSPAGAGACASAVAAAPGPVLAAGLAWGWPGLQRADGVSRLPAETSCSAGFSRVIDALPTLVVLDPWRPQGGQCCRRPAGRPSPSPSLRARGVPCLGDRWLLPPQGCAGPRHGGNRRALTLESPPQDATLKIKGGRIITSQACIDFALHGCRCFAFLMQTAAGTLFWRGFCRTEAEAGSSLLI